jgi:hypothetical protein
MGDSNRFESKFAIDGQLREEAGRASYLSRVEQGKVVEVGGKYSTAHRS